MAEVDPAATRALLARLRPMETEAPLIRLGGERDGGYLVPEDLDGIAACFSPGVSRIATFETALYGRGIPSFLADASVDGPPPGLPGGTFIKKFLGARSEGEFVSLDDWVRENAPGDGDLLLQMDIEGAEYTTIAAASAATMQRFRIVVMELHALQRWAKPGGYNAAKPFLDRLLDGFTVVHVHPNNCCGTVEVAGIEVPRLVEVTLLRNDRVRGARPATRFPHPLDRRNVGRADEIVLPRGLWADDSPLFGGGGDGGATGKPVHEGLRDGSGGPLPRLRQDAGRDRPLGRDDAGGARGGVAGSTAPAGASAGVATVAAGVQRRLISTGSPFEAEVGYSRAVVLDGWVFVAGTTGYDYATMTMPDAIEEQCRNTLATIARTLADAGGSLADVVRVNYILPDPAQWPACWPVLAEAFGTIRPAATMIVAGLWKPEMKIEIEVTARLRG